VDRYTLAAARRKPVAALSARELHLIGREHHQRGTETDTQVAKEMFALAIAADPDYAQAYAWQAYTVHRAITHGWGNPGGQAARDESLRLARRAVQIDPTAPLCLSRLAFSLVLHQRWEEAVAVAHTALNSDRPAFAAARNTCCEVLTAAGHPEEAAAIAAGTLALDPLRPPITHALLGRALLLAGKAEEALPPLRWCASHLPDYAPTYDSLMVAAVESGRLSEALAARSELLRLQPGWEPRNHTGLWFFRRPEDLDRFQAAHRRVAELAGAADEQQAVPAMEAPLPGTGQPPPHPGSPVSWPGNGGGLANLRQDTLVMYALQAALGDAAAAHAAAAITSELTAELVQYEDLRVVVGPDERAAQGYAMKGDVQSAGENVRAHLRLDELVTGTTVWAQRVEWPSARATGLPDGSVTALAAAIDLQIERRSLRWARQKPAKDLSAREVTLLGKEHYHRSTEAETAAARQMFTRAAALDPGYAPARAWQALAVARIAVHDWGSSGLQDTVEQAVRLARRAVELEPDSPACLASLSLSLALQDHWEDAVATARLALRTGRVAGDGARIAAGEVLAAAGHPAEAEEVLRHAIARDPHCFPIVHVVLGRALLLNGRCDEAMSELRRCLAQLPDYALGHRTLVVASVEAGLVEDACAAFKQVARLRPEWAQGSKPICWFLRRREDRERYQRAFDMVRRLDGAAKAGGLLPASTSRA
jgi:tetratricopeptide (TPR) repeat protein